MDSFYRVESIRFKTAFTPGRRRDRSRARGSPTSTCLPLRKRISRQSTQEIMSERVKAATADTTTSGYLFQKQKHHPKCILRRSLQTLRKRYIWGELCFGRTISGCAYIVFIFLLLNIHNDKYKCAILNLVMMRAWCLLMKIKPLQIAPDFKHVFSQQGRNKNKNRHTDLKCVFPIQQQISTRIPEITGILCCAWWSVQRSAENGVPGGQSSSDFSENSAVQSGG